MTPSEQALGRVAHELRGPLTVIAGYAELLLRGEISGSLQTDVLHTILTKAREADRMVEDILVSARAANGLLLRRPAIFDIVELAHESLRRCEAPPAAVLRVAPSSPVLVLGDREQIGWVLVNLVRNAIHYSEGRPEVCISVRADDPVEIAVKDCGIGIAPEFQDEVFLPFRRGPDTHEAGLGLGLALGREVASLNDGELLLAESAPGSGSTFVLRLPAAPEGVRAALGGRSSVRAAAAV